MKAQEQYLLINTNEEIVKMLARDLMEKTDMCHCEKCFYDVCALTLNSFNGNYVTSRKGEAISNAMKGAMESKTELIVAVSKAIEFVKDNPKHITSGS